MKEEELPTEISFQINCFCETHWNAYIISTGINIDSLKKDAILFFTNQFEDVLGKHLPSVKRFKEIIQEKVNFWFFGFQERQGFYQFPKRKSGGHD